MGILSLVLPPQGHLVPPSTQRGRCSALMLRMLCVHRGFCSPSASFGSLPWIWTHTPWGSVPWRPQGLQSKRSLWLLTAPEPKLLLFHLHHILLPGCRASLGSKQRKCCSQSTVSCCITSSPELAGSGSYLRFLTVHRINSLELHGQCESLLWVGGMSPPQNPAPGHLCAMEQ